MPTFSRFVLCFIGMCLPSIALAQQPPPNTCEGTEYRAFDFWLGQWDVTTADGKPAGTNSITSAENGCLILEEWTSSQGTTGQSYNFYDPGMQKFRQVWVSQGAVIDYAGGLNEAGAMVMLGSINYHNGITAPFKGTWTPSEDGTVTQHFEQYDTAKQVWSDWFVGIYKKAN